MSPWSVGAPMDQPEMISGPPTLSRLWFGVTSPSLAASIALERSLWINQLHHPCVQKTSVFAYLVIRPCSGQLWPCGMLAVAESSLCVGVFDIFCGGRCAGQAEENIVRGRDHRRGPKQAAGTFIKGVLRCLFMGEWHQRPRYRELPKGRTTFGSGCLGYFCHAELSDSLRKSQDRRGAGHAPAISYESAWEADRAYLGIYCRGSVWASGSARNEPCLPGCVGGSEPEDCDMGLSHPTPPAFSTPGEAFSLLSMSSPAIMPAPVTPEGVFGPMVVGGAMIGGDAAPQMPPSFPILATPMAGYFSCDYDSGSYDSGYPSCDYDSCSDDSGYPSCDYDFCCDDSGKLSIPAGGIKAAASMELSHVRGQRGRYASWDEQRQRQTPSLRKGVSVAEAAKRPSIA